MLAAQVWAAYSAAILGAPVEDAADKFAALPRIERDAWEAAIGVIDLAIKEADVPRS